MEYQGQPTSAVGEDAETTGAMRVVVLLLEHTHG
jgi:hypothetical protein